MGFSPERERKEREKSCTRWGGGGGGGEGEEIMTGPSKRPNGKPVLLPVFMGIDSSKVSRCSAPPPSQIDLAIAAAARAISISATGAYPQQLL